MRRLTDLRCPVEGPVETAKKRFTGAPETWLPAPARWRGTGEWMVRLNAGPLGRTVICRIGPPWRLGTGRWRSVAWEPVPLRGDVLPVERGLPRLTGELGLVTDGTAAWLSFRGSYAPPAGAIGRLADAAALHAVARRTAEEFLSEVAARLVPADVETPVGG